MNMVFMADGKMETRWQHSPACPRVSGCSEFKSISGSASIGILSLAMCACSRGWCVCVRGGSHDLGGQMDWRRVRLHLTLFLDDIISPPNTHTHTLVLVFYIGGGAETCAGWCNAKNSNRASLLASNLCRQRWKCFKRPGRAQICVLCR